jgi:preprotein translocase subunit SecB
MAELGTTQDQPRKNPLELAIPVAQRVQIRNILLAGCRANRSPATDLSEKNTKITSSMSEVSYGKDVESGHVFVKPTFVLSASREGREDAMLSIEASFVLFYTINSFDGIEDENLEAFSVTNGVYNAWPYWREFVQSTTARMGINRALILPVYRVGENPFEEQDASVDAEPGDE